jgi:hypothetical protein
MRVDLRQLQPNPMRDMRVDPIDPDVVERLKASIEEDGFWGGVVCRNINGSIQIGAGHHRVAAALAAGITVADVFMADHLDDADMLRVYARENATQRGNTGTAMAGSVAGALRLIAKAIFTGNISRILEMSERGEQTIVGKASTGNGEGIGEPLLTRFFHQQHIPGMGRYTVEQQLANLKASGLYAKIMTEVEEEIEREREEARRRAEAKRLEVERAAQARRDAEARRRKAEEEARQAEAERRAAAKRAREAREEADRRRAEEDRRKAEESERRAELEKRVADELAQNLEADRQMYEANLRVAQAESRQHDAAAVRAKQAAAKAVKDEKRVFDFEGVSQYLRNSFQVSTFREVVKGEGVSKYFGVNEQEALAARLVEAARQQDKRGENISADFIREYILSEVFSARQTEESVSREEQQRLLHESYVLKARKYQHEMTRYLSGLAAVGHQLHELWQDWPDGLAFPLTDEFRHAVARSKPVIETLAERIGS